MWHSSCLACSSLLALAFPFTADAEALVLHPTLIRSIGFQIDLPSHVRMKAGCRAMDHGVGEAGADRVPLAIFPDTSTNTAYLLPKVVLAPLGQLRPEVPLSQVCKRRVTTLENAPGAISSGIAGWKIRVRAVADDLDLQRLTVEEFGPGCQLGAMKERPWTVWDVFLESVPRSDPSACSALGRTVIKFSPALGRAAFWDLGERPFFAGKTFPRRSRPGSCGSEEECLEEEMIESFRFARRVIPSSSH